LTFKLYTLFNIKKNNIEILIFQLKSLNSKINCQIIISFRSPKWGEEWSQTEEGILGKELLENG
jgi:hypothetical protein